MLPISKKLQMLQHLLKKWNKHSFGHVKLEFMKAREQMNIVQSALNANPLDQALYEVEEETI